MSGVPCAHAWEAPVAAHWSSDRWAALFAFRARTAPWPGRLHGRAHRATVPGRQLRIAAGKGRRMPPRGWGDTAHPGVCHAAPTGGVRSWGLVRSASPQARARPHAVVGQAPQAVSRRVTGAVSGAGAPQAVSWTVVVRSSMRAVPTVVAAARLRPAAIRRRRRGRRVRGLGAWFCLWLMAGPFGFWLSMAR